MASNNRNLIGSYLGRSVYLSHYNVFLPNCVEGGRSLYLLLVSSGYQVDRSSLETFIDMMPLGIMVGGDGMMRLFDDIIDILSSKARDLQVMTRMAGEVDLEEVLQEFFQAFWPDENRFHTWTEYHILIGGYDADSIEAATGDILD